jgi:hypothetical protein
MEINPSEYHKSIASEINSLQNRVRYLIGDAHWGEDGRYKEAVLRSVIRRFLPSNISLGTGFVIDKQEDDKIAISKQIDIIVYDNTYPVLFSESDFVITTPANVRGIIEVKTKINSNPNLKKIISSATYNGQIIGDDIFNGIFSFEVSNVNIESQSLTEALQFSKGIVNHISVGQNIFIKYWPDGVKEYHVYEINEFSFTYFISNLLEYLSKDRMKERWWFQYPIPEGKEHYLLKKIPL